MASVLKTKVNYNFFTFTRILKNNISEIIQEVEYTSPVNSDVEEADDDDKEYLSCLECNVDFASRYSLNQHLLFHIKQPVVVLTPLKAPPPIKITLKSTSKDSFEVVTSPGTSPLLSPTDSSKLEEQEQEEQYEETENAQEGEEATNISFSPNYVNGGLESPTESTVTNQIEEEECEQIIPEGEEEYSNIPGAEPTPPPEPSPEYPKIRIKTTGLLRESLTITEITDENPEGEPTQPEMIELCTKDDVTQGSSDYGGNQCDESNMWSGSLEDPLQIPESGKDDGSILSLFGDNNERVKDLGFTSSESEFISLDRLDDRNRNALVSTVDASG